MSQLAKTSGQLDKLATRLNSLYTQMEKCYVTVCEVMGAARDYFEDDDDFWGWVEDATPFKRKTANIYLQVERNVLGDSNRRDKAKGMPFSALREIAKENVPKSVQTKVIKQYDRAAKGMAKKPNLSQVKAQVRESLGNPAVKPRPKPSIVRKASFAERLEYADKHDVAAYWLFDLPQDYCPETAALVVKHWKQKYHPDRGGDKYKFALLSEKANELEVR
jgi:hypothetical protein